VAMLNQDKAKGPCIFILVIQTKGVQQAALYTLYRINYIYIQVKVCIFYQSTGDEKYKGIEETIEHAGGLHFI